MDGGDIAYLILVIVAFLAFAGSLFVNSLHSTNDPGESPPSRH
jgi:hypothetical protein